MEIIQSRMRFGDLSDPSDETREIMPTFGESVADLHACYT